MPAVTLVCWNVEWRAAKSLDAALLRNRIFACEPDIICLTEAPADFLGGSGHIIEAEADYGYPITGNRRKVLLWSRQPWLTCDQFGHPSLPGGRFVSGSTLAPIGEMRVFGVCVPWSAAHVNTGRRDRKRWEDHQQYLSGLQALLPVENRMTVVIGDFNQAIPRRTAPIAAYGALEAAVLSRLSVPTAGLTDEGGANAIDHVAHSHDLSAVEIASLSRFGPTGEALSDHFGIAITLRPAA
jgi:hypothetical protein